MFKPRTKLPSPTLGPMSDHFSAHETLSVKKMRPLYTPTVRYCNIQRSNLTPANVLPRQHPVPATHTTTFPLVRKCAPIHAVGRRAHDARLTIEPSYFRLRATADTHPEANSCTRPNTAQRRLRYDILFGEGHVSLPAYDERDVE